MKLSDRVRAVRWAFAKSDARFDDACRLADEVEDLERLILTLPCPVKVTTPNGTEHRCPKLYGHEGRCPIWSDQ